MSCIINKINCSRCFIRGRKEDRGVPCPNLIRYEHLFTNDLKDVICESKMSTDDLLVTILGNNDDSTGRKTLDGSYLAHILTSIYDTDYICEEEKRLLFDHFLNDIGRYEIKNYHILQDHINRYVYRTAARDIDDNDDDDDNNNLCLADETDSLTDGSEDDDSYDNLEDQLMDQYELEYGLENLGRIQIIHMAPIDSEDENDISFDEYSEDTV